MGTPAISDAAGKVLCRPVWEFVFTQPLPEILPRRTSWMMRNVHIESPLQQPLRLIDFL